ncbi:MAG TPA: TonB-dependent receptor [Povalibacter sp.]|nr:TonB-dependent receptor [Povalibacter sp.]
MSKRTTTLVGAAVALALQHGAPAYSQSTPGAASDQIEEVIVTGIRGSLRASLEVKRDASSVVEALSAEDLGQFPNTNVAEAMTQVPGVAIDRRFGQGERVSIDGTDPSLNLTFLDGHPVAQSIWLFGEQPNRGFDQTQIASEIIGRIEIFKSPEARLPEGSLGGTVLMHTRKPLELEANTLTGTAAYNYNEQADEGKPSVSGLYSWKNSAETFGVAIAAQHYEEQVDRQGMEIFRYAPASTFPNATGVDPDAQVPNSINAAWFQQKRERDSVTVNLQFKPVDALELNLSGLYISEDFANYNQSMYTFLDNLPGQVDQLNVGANGIASSGHSGPTGRIFYDNNVRASEPTTRGLDLQGAWQGEGWSLSAQVGRSKSDNDLKQWFIEPVYTGGFSWDINNGVTFDDPGAARDPANWVGLGFFGNHGIFKTETKDTYGQADFSIELGGGVFDQLHLGVRRHKHDEDFSLNVYPISPVGDLAQVGTVGLTDIQGFTGDHGRHVYAGRGNVLNWVNGAPPDFTRPDAASFLNNTFQVEQTNTAGYAQLDFGKDRRLHGNVGVRFVNAKIESTAFDLVGVTAVLPAQPQWLVTQKNDEDYVLPSLNLAFDAADDVVLRFAAAKVVAWAPYNQMAPNTFLNDTQLTGAGGNADLKPYESVNYNAAVEWYFAPESVLAASVFYKDVDNFIENNPAIERLFNGISDDPDPQAFLDLVARGACSADGFCDYSVLRPTNAGKGKIKGFNLSYQQPFGVTGFGVVANYTFADGETAAGNDLPFQSESQYNVSPYFENDRFSARVTYGWRSEYLAGGFVAGAPPVSVDAYADLGLSLGWTLNEMVQFNFDAQNLLDEEYFQYFQQKSVPANSYKTGRRYQVSVQFKF